MDEQSRPGKIAEVLQSAVTKSDGAFSIFGSAITSLGLSGLVYFVLWLLFSKLLDMQVFSKMDSAQTFIIIIFFIFVVALLVSFGLYVFYKHQLKIIDKDVAGVKKTGVSLGIPEGTSFKAVIEKVAEAKELVPMLEDFSDDEKYIKIKSWNLKAKTVEIAIKNLRSIVAEGGILPNYSVKVEDGKLIVKRES